MTSKNRRTPPGLNVSGRRLYRQILSKYEFRPDEMVVLENACRVADTIARLDAALVDAPLVTVGVGGQDRIHPILVELRQQRIILASLLRQLQIPDDVPSVNQQRAAGNASWASRSGRVHGGSA